MTPAGRRDAALCLYATAYHRRILQGLPREKLFIQIGHRPMGWRLRVAGFVKACLAITVGRASRIYLPRSSAKDTWLIYALWGRRITLYSDGISDALSFVPVISVFGREWGYRRQVEPNLSVRAIDHPQRDMWHDVDGPVAVFTKRGRDFDYVTQAALAIEPPERTVVNPSGGQFRAVFLPASTVVFELQAFPRDRLYIVSVAFGADQVPPARTRLLLQYEQFLEGLGYTVVRPDSTWPAGRP